MVLVKICGLTRVDQAVACADLGADAIGLNFWPRSKRRVDDAVAREIVAELRSRVRLVAVVVDAPSGRIEEIRRLGLSWIQLHGAETPADVERWLPDAFKAVHLAVCGNDADARLADAFPGEELLVDARVGDLPGGTGVTCDWGAAAALARTRSLWLAGGLTPANVGEAIGAVSPHGVDVASGVEAAPGDKDLEKVRRFIANARAAS